MLVTPTKKYQILEKKKTIYLIFLYRRLVTPTIGEIRKNLYFPTFLFRAKDCRKAYYLYTQQGAECEVSRKIFPPFETIYLTPLLCYSSDLLQ